MKSSTPLLLSARCSAIDASHSAAIQPSVRACNCDSASRLNGWLPGWRGAKKRRVSSRLKRSASASSSSRWPAARRRPRPRSGRLRLPSTSWPRRGRWSMISRSRLSTAGSVISSASSRNSANGVAWRASAASTSSGDSLAGLWPTTCATAWCRQRRKRGRSLSARSRGQPAGGPRRCRPGGRAPAPWPWSCRSRLARATRTSLTPPDWAMREHTRIPQHLPRLQGRRVELGGQQAGAVQAPGGGRAGGGWGGHRTIDSGPAGPAGQAPTG